LERVETDHDLGELLTMIEMHYEYTKSRVARRLIDDWPVTVRKEFVKVMPTDYKRVLVERALHDEEQEAQIHLEVSNR
jgi:glutamate synthase domain-containing protein 3